MIHWEQIGRTWFGMTDEDEINERVPTYSIQDVTDLHFRRTKLELASTADAKLCAELIEQGYTK